jgi:flagellar motor component MotA
MSHTISCPHCETQLEVTSDLFGERVQCPACHEKLVIDNPNKKTGAGGKPERRGWKEKDHANADFLISMMIGVGATVLFLAMMIPFRGIRLGAIFLNRGWVNYAETLLFFWGIAIMTMKHLKNKHQREAALLNLFPSTIGDEINAHTVGAFIDNIYKVPKTLRDSIIVNRIRKALELFESRNNNNETATFIQTQSELDASRSIGSYAFIKVFLWAIPILGFIGTVMGLSKAVGSLAMGDNSDPEALTASINSLTGGLGVAFDTTLLGLILSMLMSFPLSAVQKKEDETLTLIDAFCTEKLLSRLNDSAGTADIMKEQADSIPELVQSLAKAHETFLVNLNEATVQLKESSTQIQDNQYLVQQSFIEATQTLTASADNLFTKSQEELDTTLKRLADGVEQINVGLDKLGLDKIPGKKSRRGLFGR